MRYGSVQNAEFHFFCSENRNFLEKVKSPSASAIPAESRSRSLICASAGEKTRLIVTAELPCGVVIGIMWRKNVSYRP